MKKSAEWICQIIKNKKELIEMLTEDELMEDELSNFITYLKLSKNKK
jgi:hypothetical protein